jgi:hypothetical protein
LSFFVLSLLLSTVLLLRTTTTTTTTTATTTTILSVPHITCCQSVLNAKINIEIFFLSGGIGDGGVVTAVI